MQIRITASRMMKAKDVKRQTKMLKTNFDQLQGMLDRQIQIRHQIKSLRESEKKQLKEVI